ncbi:MAG: thiamine pyrophosphate-binding protein [Candidatus Bathyarchaeota archaeon]
MKVEAANGLIRILKTEGITEVCTFPTTVFNNACGEEGLPNFMVRDERYAVAVADGISRVSDGKRFGVCSVMGALNPAGIQMAYGGLAQAYEDSSPVLCLTDGVSQGSTGRPRFDIDDAFRSVTKWSGYINKAERVPEFVRRAFTQLRSGRPSPVLLQLPRSLGEYEEEKFPYTPVKGWKTMADPRDVTIAVRALHNAKSPLIIAGQGIFYADSCQELLEFAQLVETPVLTTLKGKSCFPEDHPLSVGVRGEPAELFLRKADLIFAVGCGLSPTHFGHIIPDARGKKIVQCVIEESDVNRLYRTNHAVIGDAKLVLSQLISEVEAQGAPKQKGITDEIATARKEKMERYGPLMKSDEAPINPYRVYGELMGVLDRENSFVTHESGNTRDQLSTVFEALIPHGFLGWGNVSTLGFGLGAAMGAKIVFPERQVVCVTGDAGFGYQVGNYEAMVRNRMGITIVHINNSGFAGYGPGFWGPGSSPFTADVTPSDIVNTSKTVEGLGINSERVENPDEVALALKQALKVNKLGRPAFVEVICSKYPVYGKWIRG